MYSTGFQVCRTFESRGVLVSHRLNTDLQVQLGAIQRHLEARSALGSTTRENVQAFLGNLQVALENRSLDIAGLDRGAIETRLAATNRALEARVQMMD